jgi:hypothetical protein
MTSAAGAAGAAPRGSRGSTWVLLALFACGLAWYVWVHRAFPEAAARMQ